MANENKIEKDVNTESFEPLGVINDLDNVPQSVIDNLTGNRGDDADE